jgi:hypothetical protein
LIMLATASLAPLSSVVTLSQTSMMYSQFSDVRFSSVALAIRHSISIYFAWCDLKLLKLQTRMRQADGKRTDDIVEGVLLSAKHCCTLLSLKFESIKRLESVLILVVEVVIVMEGAFGTMNCRAVDIEVGSSPLKVMPELWIGTSLMRLTVLNAQASHKKASIHSHTSLYILIRLPSL